MTVTGKGKSDHRDNSNLLEKVRKAEGELTKFMKGKEERIDGYRRKRNN